MTKARATFTLAIARIASVLTIPSKPFIHDGSSWICTSISGKCLSHGGQQEFTAFRVFPKYPFTGVPTTYDEKSRIDDGETARNVPERLLSWHGCEACQRDLRSGRTSSGVCCR